MRKTFLSLIIGISLILTHGRILNGQFSYEGQWKLIADKSDEIPLFGNVSLEITSLEDTIKLFFTWGQGRRLFHDTIFLNNHRNSFSWKTSSRVFPYNVFLGIKVKEGDEVLGKTIRNSNQDFSFTKTYHVVGSQGERKFHETNSLSLLENGNILELAVSIPELWDKEIKKYVFKRSGYREAWVGYLSDDWNVRGSLDVQALLLSIQGLVNRNDPNLYFVYPDDWDYRFTDEIKQYLEKEKNYSFSKVSTVEKLIDTFRDFFNGYVVWDKEQPVSLDAAFTVAGLRDGIVVSEDMIPFVQSIGLKEIRDFRDVFRNKSDDQVFEELYQEYFSECNRDMIVWLGGESGKVMKPAIADWGVMNRTFFTNLSTDPVDTAEYNLASKIMGSQNPFGLVFGWHVYRKDKERHHVRLASSYGLRVEGLHTLPNMSFLHHVPVRKESKFINRHSTSEQLSRKPEKKIYISLIQTDCLGLGAWNEPGRGAFPYAWEVTMNWYWLAPVMLEYFYTQATDNDFFIGSLSGPGYIYPKAVPQEYLPTLVDSAWSLMQALDLNVFEIMDYSEGATIEGNTELTKEVINVYYDHMPGCIGFVNGYAPSFTFTNQGNVPLISYDYYLDPGRTVEDALSDIRSLASLNQQRPYFLLIHVRQWNSIDKINEILSGLDKNYEIVPLDVFLKMASSNPTYKENYLRNPAR